MPGMDDKPPQPPNGMKQAAWVLVGVLVLVLPLYVLGIGPAWALACENMIPWEAFETAYDPLMTFAEESQAREDLLVWYMEFWHAPLWNPEHSGTTLPVLYR